MPVVCSQSSAGISLLVKFLKQFTQVILMHRLSIHWTPHYLQCGLEFNAGDPEAGFLPSLIDNVPDGGEGTRPTLRDVVGIPDTANDDDEVALRLFRPLVSSA